MKSSKPFVTLVIIAAVLIAAYAVGLLIHQIRVDDSPSGTDANDAQVRQDTAKLSHAPESGRSKDSPEARAKLKEERAEVLKKMESATEEEKARFREQIRGSLETQKSKTPAGRLSTRRSQAPAGPSPVQDPNAESERTGSEPNTAGQS